MSKPTVSSAVVSAGQAGPQRRRGIVRLAAEGGGSSAESPLKVWNGTEWVSTNITVSG